MDDKKIHKVEDFGDAPEDEPQEDDLPNVMPPEDHDHDDDEIEVHFDEAAAQFEAVEGDYSADQIQILEGLEAVRLRPGMYIGSTSERGLHHLVYEVVDNSIDEALAGFCTEINVTIEADNSVTVSDNGRGIPVDMHESGKPAVEVVLTVLHAGGKFGDGGYKVSGGLHGVGVSVVNALSKSMEVEVRRDGKIYRITFSRGVTVSPLEVIGFAQDTGTKVHFLPDDEIFTVKDFNYDTLKHRLRELAFLNSGIKIFLNDKRTGAAQEFHFDGGIKSFVEHLNRKKEKINPQPIYFNGRRDDAVVEVAMQYTNDFRENIFSYVNNINTEEGGMHLVGFRTALTKVANEFAKRHNLLKNNDSTLSGEDVREGLTAVISVKLHNPQFEGQTKTKLGNVEIRSLVSAVVNESLSEFSRKIQPSRNKFWKRRFWRLAPVKLQEKPANSPDAKMLWKFLRCPASSPIAPSKTRTKQKFISSRATARAAPLSRDATEDSKLSCLCAGKF